MEIEILNMISSASINGYYEPSLELIVVWFHNIDNDKPDLVAYLQHDMSWDLRKVIEEKSTLLEDKEVIEICHETVGKFEKDSRFDDTVRSILSQIIDHPISEDAAPKIEMMKMILDSGTYHSVKN